MASMLLRASRSALVPGAASRSAAAAAAAVRVVAARSASSGPPASDPPLLGGSSPTAVPPPLSGSGLSSPAAAHRWHLYVPSPDVVRLVPEDKDVESDEAVWALYERWCKAFNQERDHDEMLRRFARFKKKVLLLHRARKEEGKDYFLSHFADGKQAELRRANQFLKYVNRRPYAKNAIVYYRPLDWFRKAPYAMDNN